MRVLVTGSEGYIGSVLVPILGEHGHDVLGVDAGFYEGRLYDDDATTGATLRRDIRDLAADDLAGVDAVVHLAELSNDPLGQLDPEVTHAINHHGSVHLARLAREAGVSRFVYTSSCSVYGAASEDLVDETSELHPQTVYAECKALVERDLVELADGSFAPVLLRNATAYGASPKMRFDIVLNNLAGLAWTTGVIRMESDGTPWRPLVHVRDIGAAIVAALEAPAAAVSGRILNVGDDGANYRIRDIAEIVATVFPGCALEVGTRHDDARSYRVSFARIREALPAFRCEWDAERGASELRDVFGRVGLDETAFRSRFFTRLRQIEHLRSSGMLDDALRWREDPATSVAV